MKEPFENGLRPIGRLLGLTSFEEGVAYRRDYRGRNFYVKVINWCRHGSYYSAIVHQQW